MLQGLLLPLCQSGDCNLREAVIVSSVLKRVSLPVLHAAAALLRIADMAYSGTNSFFIRVLLDKKYALPYRVVSFQVRPAAPPCPALPCPALPCFISFAGVHATFIVCCTWITMDRILVQCMCMPYALTIAACASDRYVLTAYCWQYLYIFVLVMQIDGLVDHFMQFQREQRMLPVVWHQSLLCFVQRYKHETRQEDKEALRKLIKVQYHYQVSPEITRELDASRYAVQTDILPAVVFVGWLRLSCSTGSNAQLDSVSAQLTGSCNVPGCLSDIMEMQNRCEATQSCL